MTEEQWLACTDPMPMLEFLRDSGRASERKLRLFCCACCRRVWDLLADERSRSAVETAERYADGLMGRDELTAAEQAAEASAFEVVSGRAREGVASHVPHVTQAALAAVSERADATIWAAWAASEAARAPGEERRHQCALLRDLCGPLPFRGVPVHSAWLTWNAGTVRHLAEAAYEERVLPNGPRDAARLAVLADALEEAGCGDAELLDHLRGPGPHARGCWAVDAILGKP